MDKNEETEKASTKGGAERYDPFIRVSIYKNVERARMSTKRPKYDQFMRVFMVKGEENGKTSTAGT